MYSKVVSRLESFGYELVDGDLASIRFCMDKVENLIKNDCNITDIPAGLAPVAVDMVAGEFLQAKKTFAPDTLTGLDLDGYAVKQIQAGDTNTTFATGDGTQTDEQRLDALILHLLNDGRGQFACYRRLRW